MPSGSETGRYDITAIKNGIMERALSRWEGLVDFVRDPQQSWGTLIYRGQGNADWEVVSTLDRLEKRLPTTPNLGGRVPDFFDNPPVERRLQLSRFKEMARGRLRSQIPEDNEDEWWALAQHHGMATPMLDWTYSPFVALYFAFEEEQCDCDGEWRAPENRAVFALTHHLISENANNEPYPKPFAPSWPGNYRLTNQAGLFVKMPEDIDLEKYVAEHFEGDTYETPGAGGLGNLHPRPILQKFVIPNDGRVECLRFLDYMNVNRASLFPDLDGAARYVNDLWEVNFNKAIGFIGDT